MFGVLGYRFDALDTTDYDRSEIGPGTVLYLRRRVWRYLRLLGKAVPELTRKGLPAGAGEGAAGLLAPGSPSRSFVTPRCPAQRQASSPSSVKLLPACGTNSHR